MPNEVASFTTMPYLFSRILSGCSAVPEIWCSNLLYSMHGGVAKGFGLGLCSVYGGGPGGDDGAAGFR